MRVQSVLTPRKPLKAILESYHFNKDSWCGASTKYVKLGKHMVSVFLVTQPSAYNERHARSKGRRFWNRKSLWESKWHYWKLMDRGSWQVTSPWKSQEESGIFCGTKLTTTTTTAPGDDVYQPISLHVVLSLDHTRCSLDVGKSQIPTCHGVDCCFAATLRQNKGTVTIQLRLCVWVLLSKSSVINSPILHICRS